VTTVKRQGRIVLMFSDSVDFAEASLTRPPPKNILLYDRAFLCRVKSGVAASEKLNLQFTVGHCPGDAPSLPLIV